MTNYFISTDLQNQLEFTRTYVGHNRNKIVDLITWENSESHKEFTLEKYKRFINVIIVDKITTSKLKKFIESSISNNHYLIIDDISTLFSFTDKGNSKDRLGGRLCNFIEIMNSGNNGFLYFINIRKLDKLNRKLIMPGSSEINDYLDLFTGSRLVYEGIFPRKYDAYLIEHGDTDSNVLKKMEIVQHIR